MRTVTPANSSFLAWIMNRCKSWLYTFSRQVSPILPTNLLSSCSGLLQSSRLKGFTSTKEVEQNPPKFRVRWCFTEIESIFGEKHNYFSSEKMMPKSAMFGYPDARTAAERWTWAWENGLWHEKGKRKFFGAKIWDTCLLQNGSTLLKVEKRCWKIYSNHPELEHIWPKQHQHPRCSTEQPWLGCFWRHLCHFCLRPTWNTLLADKINIC